MGSRGSLRVQLSLLLDDETLFDNFIIPLKENRELNSFVVKLLSSYFYDERVRALVDNVSEEEMRLDSEQDDHMADLFSNAQQIVACMGAMGDLLLDEFDNGISTVTGMMNDVAEKTGGTRSSETDFGVSVPKINSDVLIQKASGAHQSNVTDTPNSDASDEDVRKLLEKYDRRLSGIEDTLKVISTRFGVTEVSPSDDSKFSSDFGSSQVRQVEETNTSNFSDSLGVTSDNYVSNQTNTGTTQSSVEEEYTSSDNMEVDNSTETEEIIDGSDILKEFIANAEDIFG